jgi:hypothetical protein
MIMKIMMIRRTGHILYHQQYMYMEREGSEEGGKKMIMMIMKGGG